MKSNKGKFIATVAFYGLFLGLLFYAASRTLHFVQATMPPDQQYWGYLFLLATGVGAVIWLYVYLNWAEGAKQRGIAFSMGIIDLIGECILVYADTVRVSGQNGLMAFNDQETRTFVIASVGIIIINIFAGFMFKLWDPEAERKGMARDLTDDVSAAAFKELNTPESKASMIALLKPSLMQSILSQVTMDVDEMIGKMGKNVIDARVLPATPAPAPVTYHQDTPQVKYKDPDGDPIDKPWDIVDPNSEYALPCGHIRGQYWNKDKKAWSCKVCGQPDPRKDGAKLERNPDFQYYQQRPGEVRGLYTEPTYIPKENPPAGDAPFPS